MSDRQVIPFRPRGSRRTWSLVLVAAAAGGLMAALAGGAVPGSRADRLATVPSPAAQLISAVAATASPTPVPAAACAPREVKLGAGMPDLTGVYAGNDGGVYYARQLGNVIWWNGMSSRDGPSEYLGNDWNNVGRGVLGADLTIKADWSDVPRGQADGYGTVDFKVVADASGNLHIIKTSETGTGRGDSVWTPCTLVR